MFDLATLLMFAGANLIVLITPGPAILYTITRTVSEGRKAGLLSVYGLALGTLPHALAVAFGVASLIESSILAFNILKYLGAVYLVYLGISKFLENNSKSVKANDKFSRNNFSFLEGFYVGILNPKSILFFLAVLPQFVDPSRGNMFIQILVLWLLSQVMAVFVGSAYALVASLVSNLIIRNKQVSKAGNIAAGGLYIALGLAAALSGSRSR